MKLVPGSRWKSAVCETEAVIVRPPKDAGELQCGGAAMIPHSAPRSSDTTIAAESASGTLLGKRYADEVTGLEVLCSKAGKGSLAFDGRALTLRQAKKLPASD